MGALHEGHITLMRARQGRLRCGHRVRVRKPGTVWSPRRF
jgi:hypothetical protein